MTQTEAALDLYEEQLQSRRAGLAPSLTAHLATTEGAVDQCGTGLRESWGGLLEPEIVLAGRFPRSAAKLRRGEVAILTRWHRGRRQPWQPRAPEVRIAGHE